MSNALERFRAAPLPPDGVAVSELVARKLAVQSERTREAYTRDLLAFAEFTGCESTDEAIQRLISTKAAAAQDIVLTFQAALLKEGLAPSTVNRRISALRSVLKLARAIGATTVDLLLVGHLDPEVETRDVRGPGIEVIRELVAVCVADESTCGVRDATIIRWLLGTGIRRNELRSILIGDYRTLPAAVENVVGEPYRVQAAGILLVKQKRKRKKHPIPLSAVLVEMTEPWLELRGTGRGALFPTLDRRAKAGALLNPSGLNKILLRRAVQAGFPDRKLPDGRAITPHAIRHTAITEVMRKYGAAAAQAFARHANPATTQRYNDAKAVMALDAQSFVVDLL